MIKVTLVTMNGKTPVYTSETSTPREVLDQNRVNYAVGVTQLDGYSLKPGDLDKTFEQHGITETCYLSVTVKADNAATVTVIGECAVITSGLKLKDIETAEKYRPEALMLLDEDGEPEYAINTDAKSSGSINKVGATFSKTTDADGHPTITLQVERTEKIKEQVVEKIGLALLKLNKIEENFGAQLDAINADKAKIEDLIEIK